MLMPLTLGEAASVATPDWKDPMEKNLERTKPRRKESTSSTHCGERRIFEPELVVAVVGWQGRSLPVSKESIDMVPCAKI